MTKDQVIKELGLLKHPEGGYYREMYRSDKNVSQTCIPEHDGHRSVSTAIYFLLSNDAFSAFHKVIQDESWFFHFGDPIDLHMISPQGEHSITRIGNDIFNGERPQFTVPGDHWFGATSAGDNGYSLVSCTVAPGFDFNDFTLANRSELNVLFPQHVDIIVSLTREL